MSAALGDGFAGTRLQRVSGESTEPSTPARIHCPDTDRPDHLWWGYHCRLDKALQPTYGMTCDDYHHLLAKQDGRCALCGMRPRRWRLVVHHDHETGEVICLLHFTCNRLIDPLLWLLPRLVRLLVDPPGRSLGLVVPPAKLRRLETRDQAKRERTRSRIKEDQRTNGPPSNLERLRAMTRQGGKP
jgi:Recombination endonuclease VII